MIITTFEWLLHTLRLYHNVAVYPLFLIHRFQASWALALKRLHLEALEHTSPKLYHNHTVPRTSDRQVSWWHVARLKLELREAGSLLQRSGDEGRDSGEITLRRGCYLDVLVNGGKETGGEMYLARDLAESGTTGHWRRSAVCGSHGRVKRRQESWNGKGQWRPKEK